MSVDAAVDQAYLTQRVFKVSFTITNKKESVDGFVWELTSAKRL